MPAGALLVESSLSASPSSGAPTCFGPGSPFHPRTPLRGVPAGPAGNHVDRAYVFEAATLPLPRRSGRELRSLVCYSPRSSASRPRLDYALLGALLGEQPRPSFAAGGYARNGKRGALHHISSRRWRAPNARHRPYPSDEPSGRLSPLGPRSRRIFRENDQGRSEKPRLTHVPWLVAYFTPLRDSASSLDYPSLSRAN